MAKIVLAEDDAFLASIVLQELRVNHEVAHAHDGEQLLRYLEREKPDVILLDLIMPNMDGFQVLEKIKQNPASANVPVLVLTNLGETSDIERAKASGATDVMVKVNFTPKELHEKINQFLQQHAPAA